MTLCCVVSLLQVYWQLRMVHGHREVIVPLYVLIFGVLIVKYFDVLTSNFSPEAVLALGHTMTIFAWVRMFGKMQVLGEMECAHAHDPPAYPCVGQQDSVPSVLLRTRHSGECFVVAALYL